MQPVHRGGRTVGGEGMRRANKGEDDGDNGDDRDNGDDGMTGMIQ